MTWTANFHPDFSRNHIHVYWDTFTADQVSDDAARARRGAGLLAPHRRVSRRTRPRARHRWHDATGPTRLCVTAGDRNHDVIDAKLFECTDVKDLL